MNILAEIEDFLNISQKKFNLTIDIFEKNGIMCISGFMHIDEVTFFRGGLRDALFHS